MSEPAIATEYNRRVAEDLEGAREQAEWLRAQFRERKITFDHRPMRTFLRPHFVERKVWARLCDRGGRLLELAARVARRAFDGDTRRLCAYLRIPDREARWVQLDPGEPDVVLSRLDAFLTPAGPRFIEINSDAPAGFGYGDRMAEAFQELPLFREAVRARPVTYYRSGPALVHAVLRSWHHAGGRDAPRVAIVDWSDVKTRPDQEILQETFEAAGVRCLLADPRSMDLREGRLFASSRPVDVVYRRTVLAELLDREAEVRPFLQAYESRAAVFVNSLRCHLSEDKAFLAFLSDEAFSGLLSARERRLVAEVVPWTRRLEDRRTRRGKGEVDLLRHVVERRAELVLKPSHGYGGRAVRVGDQTTAAVWEAAVNEGLGGAWVVQERVPIPEETFPLFEDGPVSLASLKVNANPFYVAGADVGAVTRASQDAVINVSAGGGSVPTFVVG